MKAQYTNYRTISKKCFVLRGNYQEKETAQNESKRWKEYGCLYRIIKTRKAFGSYCWSLYTYTTPPEAHSSHQKEDR